MRASPLLCFAADAATHTHKTFKRHACCECRFDLIAYSIYVQTCIVHFSLSLSLSISFRCCCCIKLPSSSGLKMTAPVTKSNRLTTAFVSLLVYLVVDFGELIYFYSADLWLTMDLKPPKVITIRINIGQRRVSEFPCTFMMI